VVLKNKDLYYIC